MIKLEILLVLLLASKLFAAATEGPLPGYIGVATQAPSGTVNQMVCWTIVSPDDYTTMSKFACAQSTAGSSGTAACALYVDTDDTGSSHILASATASSAAAGLISNSSVSPAFSLSKGVPYRLCYCATVTNGTFLSADTSAATGFLPSLMNAFTSKVGTAAQSCSSGTPPTATGTITALTSFKSGPVAYVSQ